MLDQGFEFKVSRFVFGSIDRSSKDWRKILKNLFITYVKKKTTKRSLVVVFFLSHVNKYYKAKKLNFVIRKGVTIFI